MSKAAGSPPILLRRRSSSRPGARALQCHALDVCLAPGENLADGIDVRAEAHPLGEMQFSGVAAAVTAPFSVILSAAMVIAAGSAEELPATVPGLAALYLIPVMPPCCSQRYI